MNGILVQFSFRLILVFGTVLSFDFKIRNMKTAPFSIHFYYEDIYYTEHGERTFNNCMRLVISHRQFYLL